MKRILKILTLLSIGVALVAAWRKRRGGEEEPWAGWATSGARGAGSGTASAADRGTGTAAVPGYGTGTATATAEPGTQTVSTAASPDTETAAAVSVADTATAEASAARETEPAPDTSDAGTVEPAQKGSDQEAGVASDAELVEEAPPDAGETAAPGAGPTAGAEAEEATGSSASEAIPLGGPIDTSDTTANVTSNGGDTDTAVARAIEFVTQDAPMTEETATQDESEETQATPDTIGAVSEADAGETAETATATAPQRGWVKGDGSHDCPEGYPIKGNASSMIYHMLGQPSYDATIPELCFATEDDARARGYRPRRQ